MPQSGRLPEEEITLCWINSARAATIVELQKLKQRLQQKAVRFRFVEVHRDTFPETRLCHVMDVSMRGPRAFRSRPASRRQRSDLVTLAHIKEQS